MAKVVYLFGAGASAQSLPVVKNIPGALNHFLIDVVEKNRTNTKESLRYGITRDVAEKGFVEELQDLIEQLNNHASIDTYAKKLRITGQGERYTALKIIFSSYLIYTQITQRADKRYDSFFAAILGTHMRNFKGDMRILSWNYDFQFEKSFSAYSSNNSLSMNQALLNVSNLGSDSNELDKFGIYKLNGTAGFLDTYHREVHYINDDLLSLDTVKFFTDLMRFYAASLAGENVASSLYFAWDRMLNIDEQIPKVKTAIKDAEILVIIGYSIPFFNREIDRGLIDTIKPTIRKVYIQDLNPKNVEDSFRSIWTYDELPKIHLIDSVDQFFLPPEL